MSYEISPVLLDYSKVMFDESRAASNAPNTGKLDTAELVQDEKDQDFSAFLRYLTSSESNAMAPTSLDCSHPISDYFVSTSHNTYLSGNQLYGTASAGAYATVRVICLPHYISIKSN